MRAEAFLEEVGASFFTGVPDSRLKALSSYLVDTYGTDPVHHVIAANEGNAAAIASGFYLATGKIPVLYLQNSGEGNLVNPLASLMNPAVYGIPAILVIGWRGEPTVPDEPQHAFQGKITCELLDVMQIPYMIVSTDTTEQEIAEQMTAFRAHLDSGEAVAFVIREGGLTYSGKTVYGNAYSMKREEAIRIITSYAADDFMVATTGKAGRELFEIREGAKEGHSHDFLTVGSMGHASSIALGIALQQPEKRIWCLDGDGAALMHMGAMAVIGKAAPENLIHVVLNNEAHESVGGMPTAADSADLCAVAKACGYSAAECVADEETLRRRLLSLQKSRETKGPVFLEVKTAIGARDDLGRPTIPPADNKKAFMRELQGASA